MKKVSFNAQIMYKGKILPWGTVLEVEDSEVELLQKQGAMLVDEVDEQDEEQDAGAPPVDDETPEPVIEPDPQETPPARVSLADAAKASKAKNKG